MRAVYSYMVGPYIGRIMGIPRGGAIDAGYYGAIYSFARAVRAAGDTMEEMGVDKLRAMSMDELIELAYDIVDQHALSEEEFSAITTHHGSALHREIVEKYAKEDDNPYWKERKALIDAYEARSLPALKRVINIAGLDRPIEEVIPEYAVSPMPEDMNAPRPWEAPFLGQDHVKLEVAVAYTDLHLLMDQKYGNDLEGLIKAVTKLRDVLRPPLEVSGGEVDRAVRRRLAVLYQATAIVAHELQSQEEKPDPAQQAKRKIAPGTGMHPS